LFLQGYLFSKYKPIVHAETKTSIIIGERKPALPTYSMTEVAKHTTKEKGMEKKNLKKFDLRLIRS
jgi:hypothetical protein